MSEGTGALDEALQADAIARAVERINIWRTEIGRPPMNPGDIDEAIYTREIEIAFEDDDEPLPGPRPDSLEVDRYHMERWARENGHVEERTRPIPVLLTKLKGVKSTGPQKYKALCPAHDDHNPSLRVFEDAHGAAGLRCYSGCTTDEILSAIGLEKRDLFPRVTWHVPSEQPADSESRELPDASQAPAAATAAQAHSSFEVRGTSPIIWRGVNEIFQPLPEVKWLVRGLQICPGRPHMLAGYGASAKTLSAQQLALAVASGTPVWGNFETRVGRVRHLDYEQGWGATARRYQRLALGHGIDQRLLADMLEVAVFPQVHLDSPGALDAYSRISEGVDLMILDALRGATPTMDENASSIRVCLDNLSRVSERTGTAFVVLHHAGKPKDGHSDARTILRGSSAIFDACGCVLVVTAGATKDDPRNVSQQKQPAEAEGGHIDDFTLTIEDVANELSATAGVRVVHDEVTPDDSPEAQIAVAKRKWDANKKRILATLAEHPNQAKSVLAEKSGIKKATALMVIDELAEEGRVIVAKEGRAERCRLP